MDMDNIELQDVYKISGVPTYTFVKPRKYNDLLINLRTPGRALIIEGPSGIGKTTAIHRAIADTHTDANVMHLSARRKDDIEYIKLLSDIFDPGTIIIDDFHVLPEDIKEDVSNYLKLIADYENSNSKIIIVGINRAGDSLIQFSPDLVNRVDIIRFEAEPDENVFELLHKGETALNINLGIKSEIVTSAAGSFYIAQLLAHNACTQANITEKQTQPTPVEISFEAVVASVHERLSTKYYNRVVDFCRGPKFRPTGRAPYLHLLYWLSNSDSWTLDLRDALRRHPELRGSVSQIVDKGFLNSFVRSNKEFQEVLHYDSNSKLLSIEDPQFLFYIRGLSWHTFAREIGFSSVDFDRKYDFALSFAGSDRDIADALFRSLMENEVEVFYDKNEAHRMLAMSIEEYLAPIYKSEAQFVIVIHGPEYPNRLWTKFESDVFKERYNDGEVIPIWVLPSRPSSGDPAKDISGIFFDRDGDYDKQIHDIVAILLAKLRG